MDQSSNLVGTIQKNNIALSTRFKHLSIAMSCVVHAQFAEGGMVSEAKPILMEKIKPIDWKED